MLDLLLPEILEDILRYCDVDALKEISCCSTVLRTVCRTSLWYCVKIRLRDLEKSDFKHFHCIQYLHLTKELKFWFPKCYHNVDPYRRPRTEDILGLDNLTHALVTANPVYLETSLLPQDATETFKKLCNLVELDLRYIASCDKALEAVSVMVWLKELSLTDGLSVTDIGIEHLSKLVNLRVLSISRSDNFGYERFTDCGFEYICKLLNLKSLTLIGCKALGEKSLILLSNSLKLHNLYIECFVRENHIVRRVNSIAQITTLRSLSLPKSGLTDQDLAEYLQLCHLRQLNITYSPLITDIGLLYISNLDTIQVLNISQCKNITDSGFKHVSKLRNLKTLHCSGCVQMTDSALLYFSNVKLLEELDISECCLLTETGVSQLNSLVNLRYVDITGCPQIKNVDFVDQSRVHVDHNLPLRLIQQNSD